METLQKTLYEYFDMDDGGEEFVANMDILDRKVEQAEYSFEEHRDLFGYRGNNGDGYTIGHKICRRRFGRRASLFSTMICGPIG